MLCCILSLREQKECDLLPCLTWEKECSIPASEHFLLEEFDIFHFELPVIQKFDKNISVICN